MKKGTKEAPAGIVRVCGRGVDAVVEVGGSEMVFTREDNFDYFVVNTDSFAAFAPKGSIVEVWTGEDETRKPADVVLAAGNKQLEIMPYAKARGLQILGTITEVKHWPGQTARNYVL